MRWIQPQIRQKYGLSFLLSSSLSSSSPAPSLQSASSAPSSTSGNKSSSSALFTRDILVILAVIFFISGALHLFVRFLLRKRSSSSSPNPHSTRYRERANSEVYQRQLQQLFHLHDSGLDQAFIDALPVFLYKELMGLKEPFDCAVCLCEFSEQDKLRLLPLCSHAFHIHCIDTWLLSNSTCPLCRGTLFTPGFSVENPIFDFDDSREEDVGVSCNIVNEKRVFSVRLGKFRNTNDDERRGEREKEVAETTNSNIDARRCYSLGSFQYVVANSDLQVAFCPNRDRGNGGGNDLRLVKERMGQNGNSLIDGDADGKKISIKSKGESFSVSKIWLWSKKGKFSSSSDTRMVSSSVNVSLPLRDTDRTQAT